MHRLKLHPNRLQVKVCWLHPLRRCMMGREGRQRSGNASAVQLVPTKTSFLRFISMLPAQEFGSERKISSGKPNIWNKEKCLPCSLTGCSLFYDSAFGFIPCQPPSSNLVSTLSHAWTPPPSQLSSCPLFRPPTCRPTADCLDSGHLSRCST